MPGPARDSGTDDSVIAIAIALIGVALLLAVFAKPLHQAMWAVLRTEAHVVALARPLLPAATQERFDKWANLTRNPPKDMTPSMTRAALSVGGQWLRWPLLLLYGGLGVWLLVRSPIFRYRRTLDFEGLIHEQARTFPRMRPVLWLKGRIDPATRGNYTRQLSPYEWAVACGAITSRDTSADTRASWSETNATAAFSQQLGTPIGNPLDPSALPYHERLLFAAFAARITDRMKDSDLLLDGIASGFGPDWVWSKRVVMRLKRRSTDWPPNGPWRIALTAYERRVVDQVLATAQESEAVQRLVRRHGHSHVLLAAMLGLAQELSGILTSSDFIWVKAVDRPLHYVLNDVGRRVASTEVAGVRSHFLAETERDARIAHPQVQEAVDALRINLEESSWEPPPLFRAKAAG